MSKGEMTRQKIVAEAAALFNQRGFAGCSMQDVMDATGLEKGGLYRHFACKEDLAAEAFRYAMAEVKRMREDGLDEIAGAVERLKYMVRRFVNTRGTVPGGCPLMNTAIDTDDGNAVLRGLALGGIREWKSKISGVVQEGIETGEIAKGTDPQRIASVMIATLEGSLMMSRLEGNKVALEHARVTLEGMIDGIAATLLEEERQS